MRRRTLLMLPIKTIVPKSLDISNSFMVNNMSDITAHDENEDAIQKHNFMVTTIQTEKKAIRQRLSYKNL